MTNIIPLHRQTRLDRLCERLLRAYRQTLIDAIACEPAGPARFLRAHISGIMQVTRAQTGVMTIALKLLQYERYQHIWFDFLAEACAMHPDEHNAHEAAGLNVFENSLWECSLRGEARLSKAMTDTIP